MTSNLELSRVTCVHAETCDGCKVAIPAGSKCWVRKGDGALFHDEACAQKHPDAKPTPGADRDIKPSGM